jgi:hypothetical protein
VKLSVSDSCEFENSWGAISTLIIPSAEDTEKIFNKHESAKSNTVTPPSGKKYVARFKIARHHFPLGFFRGENQLGNWVTPMTREEAISRNCYPDRNLGSDTVIQFNPDLGKGMGERWRRDNPKQMFIKAPTVPLKEVESVISDLMAVKSDDEEEEEAVAAAAADSPGDGNISSATSSARRINRMKNLEQLREEEERNRTPEQWKAIIAEHEAKAEALMKKMQQVVPRQWQMP